MSLKTMSRKELRQHIEKMKAGQAKDILEAKDNLRVMYQKNLEKFTDKIDMFEAIIDTLISSSDVFARQDVIANEVDKEPLPSDAFRAFITAQYKTLVLTRECDNNEELGKALLEEYTMAVMMAGEANEKA